MPPTSRRLLQSTGLLAGVVVLLLAFRWLAADLTARHLAGEAGRSLDALKSGQPLWQWQPRGRHDLVAGRVFGDAVVEAGDDGLEITSRGSKPFELGLPIALRLDLAHWPILAISGRAGDPVEIAAVWVADSTEACATAPLATRDGSVRIDLRHRPGYDRDHRACPLPVAASMLRLRITAPAGTRWTLRHVALDAPGAAGPSPHLSPQPGTPPPVDQQIAGLDGSFASPVVWLPEHASAEQMLAWRDRATSRQAATLVLRRGTSPGQEAWRLPHGSGWMGCAIYVFALIVLARRPRSELITLVAGLAGPLWVIVGLQWGIRGHWPGAIAFVAALGYAAWVERPGRPKGWHWLGRWRTLGWWWPLLLLPVAWIISLAWGHAFEPVRPGRVAVYLGWAALQQWLILGFALPRLEALLPEGPWAVLAAATLFALMHTPNGALMQLCFLAELVWAACFVRSRSLLPIALAHASCALVVGAALIGTTLRSLEVSARFFL